MKKIFILTGEPSGDKLAAEAIKELKKNKNDIEYLSVGGQHLKSIGIKSIYDQKDITYIAFTDILLNIFKIKRKINETVKKIYGKNPKKIFSEVFSEDLYKIDLLKEIGFNFEEDIKKIVGNNILNFKTFSL